MNKPNLSADLLGAMAKEMTKSTQRGCVVGKVVAELQAIDPDAAAIVSGWLATDKDEIGHTRLANSLRQAGISKPGSEDPLTSERIGTHRPGRCSCQVAGLQ